MTEREEWLWRWYTCPLPTVAAVQGIAYGAGALLAACADLRVAGPGTRFKVTAMSYGYPGLSWLLADLIGASRAKDVLFTGAAARRRPGGQAADARGRRPGSAGPVRRRERGHPGRPRRRLGRGPVRRFQAEGTVTTGPCAWCRTACRTEPGPW
jgi:Enoyl-CoA hydratase/isomerase